MKRIIIPQDVLIEIFNNETQAVEEVEFSFKDFIINNALQHISWGNNIDSIIECIFIENTLNNLKEYQDLILTDSMYEKLNKLVCYPDKPYDIKIAKKLITFFLAVKNAEDQ